MHSQTAHRNVTRQKGIEVLDILSKSSKLWLLWVRDMQSIFYHKYVWWWELQPSKIRIYIQNLKFPEPLEWDDTHSWRVSFPIIVMFHTAGWYVSFFVLLLLPGNSWWTVVITELDSHLMKIKTLWQQDKRLVLMRCLKIVLNNGNLYKIYYIV